MQIEFDNLSPTAAYHLITQTVIPRPIAWVLTKNVDGQSHNLAPFSYFSAVSSEPPLLMFSCAAKPEGGLKDTVINTLREEKLVIHIATETQLQALQDSAQPLNYGDSEVALIAADLCDFAGTGQQRLSGAPIAFACRLHHSDTVGKAQTLIFAEIESVYIDDAAVSKNGKRLRIDAKTIAPLGRLGLGQFVTLADVVMPQ
ncbi:MAG: protein/domain typically associated with flavoprotein oxygenase, DIM6/NTAB family protein [Gammaproteobacteria bacterium]|nr:MAG: protein/domain typically associated with flavoprotein oxygenase, DIM6/NTAB family protein [Gammaproteobacteria bacterium]